MCDEMFGSSLVHADPFYGRPTILACRGLRKEFTQDAGWFRAGKTTAAVAGVDLDVRSGECVGIVGESGSGKSTLGRLLIRLLEPTSGEVLIHGKSVSSLQGRALQEARRPLQMIFQDPYSSLNPRLTVKEIIAEPLTTLAPKLSPQAISLRVSRLAADVGLDGRSLKKRPHEFSGGQRQRIAIARALAAQPELLICDEPISALDVSIGAQILNLLRDLRSEHNLSLVFISHQLAAVSYLADRVAVMQAGRLVEIDQAERIFTAPRHPFTRELLAAQL